MNEQQREALEALDFVAQAEDAISGLYQPQFSAEIQRLRTYILNSMQIPEGLNFDWITDALYEYSDALRSGELDGAGRSLPENIEEQADLLDSVLTPEEL